MPNSVQKKVNDGKLSYNKSDVNYDNSLNCQFSIEKVIAAKLDSSSDAFDIKH